MRRVKVYKDAKQQQGFLGYAQLLKKVSGRFDGIMFTDDECCEEIRNIFITKGNFWKWELEDDQMELLKQEIRNNPNGGIELEVRREVCEFFEQQRWEVKLYPKDGTPPYICTHYIRRKTGKKALHLPDVVDQEIKTLQL